MNPFRWMAALFIAITLSAAAPPQSFQLPNGLRVVLMENHERPLVRLELQLPWDPAEEPEGKEGMGGFLAELLARAGGGPYKRAALQQYLEERALRYSFSMDARRFKWSMLAESQAQDAAFEGLALTVMRPQWDPAQVTEQRQRFQQANTEKSARQRAEDRFRRRIGDPEALRIPAEASLNRINDADLEALMRRVVRPEKAVLVILGDMSLAQARQLAVLHLGAWGPRPEAPVGETKASSAEPAGRLRLWAVKNGGGVVEILAGAAPSNSEPPSQAERELLQQLLTRDASSQSPTALASLDWQLWPNGAWLLKASGSAGKTAPEVLEALRAWLLQRRVRPIAEQEMADLRAARRMMRATRNLHPEREAQRLAAETLAGRSEDAVLDGLSASTLTEMLQRMLAPERTAYFVTGALPADAEGFSKAGLGAISWIN